MIVFGPVQCSNYLNMEKDQWYIFNLTGYHCNGYPLANLYPHPNLITNSDEILFSSNGDVLNCIDIRYNEYIMNTIPAFGEILSLIRQSEESNVYVCINDYECDMYASLINELLMRFISNRYSYKYHIINQPEDLSYICEDGSNFRTLDGLRMYDIDVQSQEEFNEKIRLENGGVPNEFV